MKQTRKQTRNYFRRSIENRFIRHAISGIYYIFALNP